MYLIYRWVIRVLYALLRILPTQERVAFLSRQGNVSSLDFVLLEAALRDKLLGWKFVTSSYRDNNGLLTRVWGTLRQLRLVATSRLCVVDGYTPAVSIPHLDPSTSVVQLWHALGAFKRFGWQAVGTPAGRSSVQATQLCMHRNYMTVIAGGPGACKPYSQAFACAEEAVIPLGIPRMDYLLEDKLSRERKHTETTIRQRHPELAGERVNILFVPIFRRGENEADTKGHLRELAGCLPAKTTNLIVAFHPFGAPGTAPFTQEKGQVPIIHIPHTKGIDLLGIADYVITDYSAIAFEAALLRRKVLFYVPDIVAYRHSPGLNIDPQQEFPAISFSTAEELAAFIERDLREGKGELEGELEGAHGGNRGVGYASSGFWSYCESYLAQPAVGATDRLATYLAEMVASGAKSTDRGDAHSANAPQTGALEANALRPNALEVNA